MDDAKIALDYYKDYLTPEVILNQTYWMADKNLKSNTDSNEIDFLPAYDEIPIIYRDRAASLSLIKNNKV